MTYTKDYLDKLNHVKLLIDEADAVVIGAGSGLSTSAGLDYSYDRFSSLFPDFIEKYKYNHMYHAAFQEYDSLEEHFAYWSRHIYYNRYEFKDNGTYRCLYNLIKDKNYFVLTTNADHLFVKNNFDKDRLFYTQGNYGLWQCSVPCHNNTYDNFELVSEMINTQVDMKIPTDLIPYCPKCGELMTTNLRKDDTFVEDEGWHKASLCYSNFINDNKNKKVLFLELGVGLNTPGIIKYPFWNMCYQNVQSNYVVVGLDHAVIPNEIIDRSLSFEEDISEFLNILKDCN